MLLSNHQSDLPFVSYVKVSDITGLPVTKHSKTAFTKGGRFDYRSWRLGNGRLLGLRSRFRRFFFRYLGR